jgi:small-conductance mechanosensitive channel
MNVKYYLASSLVIFAVLFKYGVPVAPLLAGVAAAGLWLWRQKKTVRS